MLRFIFVCMGVVALSALSIMTQFMTDGISDAQTQIAERNVVENNEDNNVVALAPLEEPSFSEDQLNNIETAAGADDTDYGFGTAFSNEAPKALADDDGMAAALIEPSAE